MSLSSLLLRPDVKRQLADAIRMPAPIETFYGDLRVSPRTDCPTLVGTAFDYLLRFRIETLNPTVVRRTWVAETALAYAQGRAASAGRSNSVDWRATSQQIGEVLSRCHEQHRSYLRSGTLTDALLSAVFDLAQLDHFVRGRADALCLQDVGDARDELAALYEIVPTQYFVARETCVLNPTFGVGSSLVGGADADLLLDHKLVEIKTITARMANRALFEQLVTYVALSEIGGIDGQQPAAPITVIGVYSARHACYHAWSVDDIVPRDDLTRFVAWLLTNAQAG
jgi:hypothetical protein